MSIKPFRATSVVEFDCSPWPEGMACIAFGLLFAVIMSLYFIINGVKTAFGAVLVYAIAAALTGHGVYLWRFRRKPFRRKVNLGGMQHRLYRRGHWLFAACSFVRCCVEYAVIITLITLLDGGTDFAGAFAERLRGWFFLLPLIMYGTFREYLSYYQYYHTPAGLRRDLFAKTTKTDLYTEAMKQMNDGKEGKQH